jgi:hypothetical protein
VKVLREKINHHNSYEERGKKNPKLNPRPRILGRKRKMNK